MNVKTRRTKKQVNVENQAIKLLAKEELGRKIEVIKKELRSYTWRDLETNGKFAKNDKLSFITDDMLIAGCDIGSETHYIRAIDVRGRELSSGAFEFSNTSEGFANAKAWVLALAAKNDKKQIVLGLEPTGHYWFALAAWMISNGISVVQVNPYAVKQSKEIAYRRQDKKYQSSSQGIKNLFPRIHGRIWKNRWSIYFGSTENISYPIGYHSTGSRRHKKYLAQCKTKRTRLQQSQ